MLHPLFKITSLKIIACLVLVNITLLTAGQDRDISKLSSGGKLNPLQANMDIRHYTLSLSIDIAKESINGFTDIDIVLAKAADTILLDLINLYKVSSITINGKEERFSHVDNKLYIYGDKQYPQGKIRIRGNIS